MQSVSTAFRDAFASPARQISARTLVRWDGTNYTDETSHTLDWDVTLRIAAPGDNLVNPGDVGRGGLTLANKAGRFSWKNTAGPLYANIGGATGLGGKRLLLQVGTGSEWLTVFTGYITDWSEPEPGSDVSLTLADEGWAHLQKRASTPVFARQRPDQWIDYLADLAGVGATGFDVSPHLIPWCWLDDESLLEEIWKCANADGGRAYFDQLGMLRYETAAHWLTHSKVTDFTTTAEFGLNPRHELGELAKEVIVDYAPRARGALTVIYKLDSLKAVRPGATEIIDARFQYPVTALAPLTAQTDYVMSTTSGDAVAGVTISVTDANAQRARISIVNSHATKTAVIFHLQLRGWPLLGGASEQESALAASDPLGMGRVRTQRGNPYCQTEPQARVLAGLLAARSDRIQPVWPVEVWAMPQLELGDRIGLRGLRMSSAVEGFVIQNKLSLTREGGLKQELQALDAATLYPYSNYYVVGQTALGPSGGRVWF